MTVGCPHSTGILVNITVYRVDGIAPIRFDSNFQKSNQSNHFTEESSRGQQRRRPSHLSLISTVKLNLDSIVLCSSVHLENTAWCMACVVYGAVKQTKDKR